MPLYGYGKIADIDLTSGTVSVREVDATLARDYTGGMGFGAKILYDQVGPAVDPLSAGNVVVFANGPLTGTHAPCSGRTEITTKSALTGIFGSGNTGGLWGTYLKHAGFDVVVVRGQSEKPVYLWIDDGAVQLKPAAHLWGKETGVTADLIKGELDSSAQPRISVLAIGPAGENQVRFACAFNDRYHTASRNGAGAVLGFKRLKAIAVRGTGSVNVARPEEFSAASKAARERIIDASRHHKPPGAPPEAREFHLNQGCLPGRNFQTGIAPDWLATRGVAEARKYFVRKEATCYACPVSCFNLVQVREGKYAGVTANRGLMPGVVLDWGAKCGIGNLPAIWKCKELCQELGMDYASAAGTIAFAMELYQRGLIDRNDADGLELEWGNEGAVMAMLHKIANREGFGAVLAEGSVRAAKVIGRGADRYVMATKGMEMMSSDPRSGPRGWVFGDLTSPRGGDNVKGTHFRADRYNPNWWVEKFDMFPAVKEAIYGTPAQDIAITWEGKPLMTRWFEDLYSANNALGLCFYPTGHLALGPTYLARLYSACTGCDTTPEELVRMGEKVFTLARTYNVRQGMSRKEDTWPDRFFGEALPEGPAEGAVLSREEVTGLLDEYYELRGWDVKTGVPTQDTLQKLGLGDIARDLGATGKRH